MGKVLQSQVPVMKIPKPNLPTYFEQLQGWVSVSEQPSGEPIRTDTNTRFCSSTVQCSAVHCSAVQCSAVQCSAVQCSAVRCGAVQLQARLSLSFFLARQTDYTGPAILQLFPCDNLAFPLVYPGWNFGMHGRTGFLENHLVLLFSGGQFDALFHPILDTQNFAHQFMHTRLCTLYCAH